MVMEAVLNSDRGLENETIGDIYEGIEQLIATSSKHRAHGREDLAGAVLRQAWREFLPHLAVTVALVKQHHSRTRLARREVRRLEHSSVRRGQIHHPWGGSPPGCTLHYPNRSQRQREKPFVHERIPRRASDHPRKNCQNRFHEMLWGPGFEGAPETRGA